MKLIKVKEFCDLYGYNHRKQRYEAMEKYFGIGAGTIKDIISFDRYLRDILEVDEVGQAKEKEWQKSPAIHNFEYETDKQLNLKLQ